VIVLDASAAIDWLLRTTAGQQIEKRIYLRNESLAAPHLLDLEVTQVLRRLVRSAVISTKRAEEAIHDLMDLQIARFPHHLFLQRIWQLRNNLSAYDAMYVGLAESLRATLITRDLRLGSASGHSAIVEVF
jgi:predicted nucleic acid-binding protein